MSATRDGDVIRLTVPRYSGSPLTKHQFTIMLSNDRARVIVSFDDGPLMAQFAMPLAGAREFAKALVEVAAHAERTEPHEAASA